ncbi:MAG: kelch repeat-containing protein [Chloroflexota bacterium]
MAQQPSIDTDRLLTTWLERDAGLRPPDDLLERVLSHTAATRRRPGWSIPRRWIPAPVVARARSPRPLPDLVGSPTPGTASVVVVRALLLVAAVGALVVAAVLLRPSPGPVQPMGRFEHAASMPAAMGWLLRPGIAVLDDGRVLVAGGGQEIAQSAVYDPTTDTWSDPIPMAAMHPGATATRLLDGRILVAGGRDGLLGRGLAAASLFDPTTDTFVPTGSMTQARERHTATLLEDGRVLIVGGEDVRDGTVAGLGTAELYDPSTGTFSPTRTLAGPRAGHTATRLEDGSVLVVGGYVPAGDGPSPTLAAAERYDPDSGMFRATGSLGTPRADQAATLLPDGRVLVVGGVTEAGASGRHRGELASAELYDPTSGTFTMSRGSLVTERSFLALTTLPDGTVLVTGGTNGAGEPRTAERYIPAADAFVPAGRAASAHELGAAPLLLDGRVFLPEAGAWPAGGPELYDPDAAAAEVVPVVPQDGISTTPVDAQLRGGHTATLLADGRVLIVGGVGTGGMIPGAEVFDPVTDETAPAGTLALPRWDPVAVRLPEGRVLITGGTGDGPPQPEIWDPATGAFTAPGAALAAALAGHQVLPVDALGPGRLVLIEPGETGRISVLDLSTMAASHPAVACRQPAGGVELTDGRILEACDATGVETAYVYDPVRGTATRTAVVEEQLLRPLRLADGRVLGGNRVEGPGGGGSVRYTTLFDPADGSFAIVPGGADADWTAGVVASLPDGRLLAAGGDEIQSGQLWAVDPSSWSQASLGRLATLRMDPTITVLPDGRALVLGGAYPPPDRTDPLPPGAEIVDPLP